MKTGLPGEIEQSFNNLPDPLSGLGYGFEIGAHLIVQIFSAQQHVGIREYTGKRVVDFMGHPRCKPSNAGLFYRMKQLMFALHSLLPKGCNHILKGFLQASYFAS